MPGYAGSGQATLLFQNQQVALLQQATGIVGRPSIAVQLERNRSLAPTGVSLQVYFTDANGHPASPGAFEIDVQTSDLDEDIQYVTAEAFTGPLNAGFAGNVDLSGFYARYVRVFVRTLASAVFTNVYITSFATAGGAGSGGGGGGGGGPALQVNGTPTGDQALLNLVAGANITITDEGGGAVQIAGTSGPTLALEVNGTPNADQNLLNLVAGSGVTITDQGAGAVQIASAGGPAAMTLIQSVVAPGTPSISFLAIPQTYNALVIEGTVTTDSNSPALVLQANGLGGGNYGYSNWTFTSTGLVAGGAGAQGSWTLGPLPDGRANSIVAGIHIYLPGYSQARFNQWQSRLLFQNLSSGAVEIVDTVFVLLGGNNITSLVFTASDGSNFIAGTRLSLYGMS